MKMHLSIKGINNEIVGLKNMHLTEEYLGGCSVQMYRESIVYKETRNEMKVFFE